MKLNLEKRNPNLVIAVFAVICMLPAFVFGVGGFDAAIHGMWIEGFSDLLFSGNIFPRHAPDFYAGYGSYIYLFYPPLSFYLSSVFMPFLSNLDNLNYYVISASCTTALFCSGMSCRYWLGKSYSEKVSLFCALLYMAVPAHLGDFYFNASPSQFWCFVWMPLILAGIDGIVKEEKNAVIKYAFPQALLLLTNIPYAIIFSPFAILYGLWLSPKGSTIRRLTTGAVFAFGLAAFYLLPMYMLKSQVNIDGHWDGALGFDYSEFFMGLDSFNMSSEVAVERIHAFMQVFRLLLIISCLYALAILRKGVSGKSGKASLVIIIISFFMVTELSGFLWEIFPILQIIQFPGRFIMISSIFSIIIAANYFDKAKDFGRLVLLFVPFLIFSYGFSYQRAVEHFPEEFNFNHENKIEYYPNYIPKLDNDELVRFYDEAAFAELPKSIVDILDESVALVSVSKQEPRNLEMSISTYSPTKIAVRWFYIKGWVADLGGKPYPIKIDEATQTMFFEFKDGIRNQSFKLYLPLYEFEKIGYLISFVTLLMVGLLFFRGKNAKV